MIETINHYFFPPNNNKALNAELSVTEQKTKSVFQQIISLAFNIVNFLCCSIFVRKIKVPENSDFQSVEVHENQFKLEQQGIWVEKQNMMKT